MKIFKQRAEGGGYVDNRGITTRQSLGDKRTPGMSEEQRSVWLEERGKGCV